MLAIQKASFQVNMFNSFATVTFSKKTFHFRTPCNKKDLSLKKLPQQPRVPELLRVSQDSGMGQESPRESQNAPDEASDALESNIDEHVYAFMVEECVLLGMISHKNSLITIFGHKHENKNFIKIFYIFL